MKSLLSTLFSLLIAGHLYATSLPDKGATQAQVEATWGAPEKRIKAVGQPPISRWVYADFTVYFEGKFVIHSVLHDVAKPVKPAAESVAPAAVAPAAMEAASESEAMAPVETAPTEEIAPIEEAPAEAAPMEEAPMEAPASEEMAPAEEPVTPEAEVQESTEATSDEQEFRFDPVTGEIILMDQSGQEYKPYEDAAPAPAEEQSDDAAGMEVEAAAMGAAIEESMPADNAAEVIEETIDPVVEDAALEAEVITEEVSNEVIAEEPSMEETVIEAPAEELPMEEAPTEEAPASTASGEPEFRFDPVTGQIIIVEPGQ